jgi:hypothetical protein
MARKRSKEQVAVSLAKWKTRLKRSVTMIDKLEKQLKRMEKAKPDLAIAPPLATRPKPKPEPLAVTIMREIAAPDPTPVREIDTSIPTFLQRRKLDPVAEQMVKDQAETKKKKAAGRIAKMKAKRSGETRKMPLTGNAALEAIRNG